MMLAGIPVSAPPTEQLANDGPLNESCLMSE